MDNNIGSKILNGLVPGRLAAIASIKDPKDRLEAVKRFKADVEEFQKLQAELARKAGV